TTTTPRVRPGPASARALPSSAGTASTGASLPPVVGGSPGPERIVGWAAGSSNSLPVRTLHQHRTQRMARQAEADSPEPGTVALSDSVVSEHQQGRIAGKGAQRFGRIADDDFGVDRRVGSAVGMRGIE